MQRHAIFAHFDAQNEIKPYIRHLLQALRPHCSRIVFVSNARLPAGALATLDGLCDRAALRDNVGFDFCMWQHAIADERLDQIDELVLVNSSVFGPLTPLDGGFERMSATDCDWWGVTDSYQ